MRAKLYVKCTIAKSIVIRNTALERHCSGIRKTGLEKLHCSLGSLTKSKGSKEEHNVPFSICCNCTILIWLLVDMFLQCVQAKKRKCMSKGASFSTSVVFVNSCCLVVERYIPSLLAGGLLYHYKGSFPGSRQRIGSHDLPYMSCCFFIQTRNRDY